MPLRSGRLPRTRNSIARAHADRRLARGRIPRSHGRFGRVRDEGHLTTGITKALGDSSSTSPRETCLTFARVLRSEWIKMITVQSTWWSILIVVVLSVGMSLLMAYARNSSLGPTAAGKPRVSIPCP